MEAMSHSTAPTEQDHATTPSSSQLLTTQSGPKFPPEIWEKVILNLRNDDLKCVRLVNSAFNDLAIPALFSCVCFSLLSESEQRLRNLASNEKLSQRVECLYLDTTSYFPNLDVQEYVKMMSNRFADSLGVKRALFKTGPLSAPKLLQVLDTDPSISLSTDYLTNEPRQHFYAGWAQYCARGMIQESKLMSDGIFKSLLQILPAFKKLRHLQTITSWTGSGSEGHNLECYLYHGLPSETFKQIPGLRDFSIPPAEPERGAYGFFLAPGLPARRLSFMSPEPYPSPSCSRTMTTNMVSAALRVLQAKNINLETLSLPGPDYIGQLQPEPRLRKGFFHIDALCAVRATSDVWQKTPLLPLFQSLRQVELQIDHSPRGAFNVFRCHIDPVRLPRALQSMKQVESLSIGFKSVSTTCGRELTPPSLYQTLLRQDSDYETLEDDEDDDGIGPSNENATANLLSALFGMPPVPGDTSLPSAGSQHNGQAGIPQAHFHDHTAAASFLSFPGADEPTVEMAHISPSTLGFQPPAPEKPIFPNPWPKLTHIKLWNMPARKLDVVRLFKTIGPGLRSLTLHDVYYTSKPVDEDPEDAADIFTATPALEEATDTKTKTKKPKSKTKPKATSKNLSKTLSVVMADSSKPNAWLETIETLGDIPLNLDACEVDLYVHDWERLADSMSAQIEGFDDGFVDVDDALSTYLLKGNRNIRAMGFALHVSGMVKAAADDETAGASSWETDDAGAFGSSA